MHECTDAAQCITSCIARAKAWRSGGRARKARTHHDIEAAEEFDSLVYRRLYVRLLANICLNCGGLDIGEALLDERECLLGCGEVNVDEEDVRALLREQER